MLQKYPGLFHPGKIIASNLEHFKSVSIELCVFVLKPDSCV